MPQSDDFAKTGLALPTASLDGGRNPARSDEYGALHSRSELLAWAQEGSYFKACNTSLGTGIAMGIRTAFSATANVLLLMRSSSATKKIIPHYIRLVNTAAGATTTSSRLAVKLDTANRYSSGGTDLLAQIVNSNTGLAPATSLDQLRFGDVTAAAESAARTVANLQLKTQAAPCWVVGDEVLLNFLPVAQSGSGLLSGAASSQFVKDVGPVMLSGANHCLLVHMWNPANATTPPSWEIEMAWWER